MTWLDLSFNRITKIEGLEKLTKLLDLSLFSNQIEVIENLDTLVDLHVFSIGAGLGATEGWSAEHRVVIQRVVHAGV